MPKVGIVISNYNGWQDTLVCLDSLQKQTFTDFEVILIDDASPNDSVAQLQNKLPPNTVFLPQERNVGFAAANNIGMRRALDDGCDFALLLNNDTSVRPDFLETLLAETPAGAVSCPKMLFMDPPDKIWFAGGELDPKTGKVTTKLVLEDKPRPPSKLSHTVRDAPGNAVAGKLHQEIRKTEDDNVGVESAHKSEEAVETGVHLVREGYRSHKLKPYRKAAQAERKLEKANIEALFQKSVYENPAAASNPLSRWQQKQQIKKQYAAAKRAAQSGGSAAGAAQKTGKAAKTVKEKAQQAGAYVMRHKKGFGIVLAIFLLVCLLLNTMSSCSMMAQSIGSAISGTTYPSDDPELVAVEADYAAKEAALQAEIDNIESSHPGYDEYRYDLDMIGHDPHELAAYLSAVLQGYTRASAQAELERIFAAQYQLTLTEEVEVRYRTETRTDSEGNEYDVEVPYNYYILNVTLTSKPISSVASELLTPDQLEMYQVYRQTLGNKPLIFGGGSADTSDSESLAGVEFVNGTRPGNQAVVDIAKSQVGNVGGQPYWSWYGFNSRVEWCACFVSWCYGQMGLSEPRFAACQSQGIPWFQSHGQWGGRDYANIAPGDAIFFDWDLDGSADHVGIVVGTDGSRVYTVEGNSGDACKIKSYSLTYECIKGYGLMNW